MPDEIPFAVSRIEGDVGEGTAPTRANVFPIVRAILQKGKGIGIEADVPEEELTFTTDPALDERVAGDGAALGYAILADTDATTVHGDTTISGTGLELSRITVPANADRYTVRIIGDSQDTDLASLWYRESATDDDFAEYPGLLRFGGAIASLDEQHSIPLKDTDGDWNDYTYLDGGTRYFQAAIRPQPSTATPEIDDLKTIQQLERRIAEDAFPADHLLDSSAGFSQITTPQVIWLSKTIDKRKHALVSWRISFAERGHRYGIAVLDAQGFVSADEDSQSAHYYYFYSDGRIDYVWGDDYSENSAAFNAAIAVCRIVFLRADTSNSDVCDRLGMTWTKVSSVFPVSAGRHRFERIVRIANSG